MINQIEDRLKSIQKIIRNIMIEITKITIQINIIIMKKLTRIKHNLIKRNIIRDIFKNKNKQLIQNNIEIMNLINQLSILKRKINNQKIIKTIIKITNNKKIQIKTKLNRLLFKNKGNQQYKNKNQYKNKLKLKLM